MAKKDKNQQEREETMEKIRRGDVKYGLEMDKIRGLLPELQEGEAYIIEKGFIENKVTLRLADISN